MKQNGELAYQSQSCPFLLFSILSTTHVLRDRGKHSHLLYSWCHLDLAIFNYYFYLAILDCNSIPILKYFLSVSILSAMALPHVFSVRFWKLAWSSRQQLSGSCSSCEVINFYHFHLGYFGLLNWIPALQILIRQIISIAHCNM